LLATSTSWWLWLTGTVLASNAGHFTPADPGGAEPYIALRLLAGLLSVLAVLVAIGGGLIALFTVLGAVGSAGAAARFAPAPVAAGIAGAGLVGGLFVTLATVLYALLLWGAAQAIRVLLSIEGHARESAALQRAMLAELRRIGAPTQPLLPRDRSP
jgi:hypothetical protein